MAEIDQCLVVLCQNWSFNLFSVPTTYQQHLELVLVKLNTVRLSNLDRSLDYRKFSYFVSWMFMGPHNDWCSAITTTVIISPGLLGAAENHYPCWVYNMEIYGNLIQDLVVVCSRLHFYVLEIRLRNYLTTWRRIQNICGNTLRWLVLICWMKRSQNSCHLVGYFYKK